MAKVQSRKTVSISAEGMRLLNNISIASGIPKSRLVENFIRDYAGLPNYDPTPMDKKQHRAEIQRRERSEAMKRVQARWPTARSV